MKKQKSEMVLVKVPQKIKFITPVLGMFLLFSAQVFSLDFSETMYAQIFNDAVDYEESRMLVIPGTVGSVQEFVEDIVVKAGYSDVLFYDDNQHIRVVGKPISPLKQMLSDRQHTHAMIIKFTRDNVNTRVDFVNGSPETNFQEDVNTDITKMFEMILIESKKK